jgi:hypothetical protein
MDRPPRRSRPRATALADPFEKLHELPGKTKRDGTPLSYLSGAQVVQRLNRVLGFDRWSFEVMETQFDQAADEVVVKGRLTIYCGRRTVVREQFGSQRHNRLRNDQSIIDSGFDHKGAATDALKKCATLVGVGLYLYGPESEERPPDWDAAEWETQTTSHARPAPPARPASGAPRPPAQPAAPAASAAPLPPGEPTDREREAAKKAAQAVYIWASKYQGLNKSRVMAILDLEPDDHLHLFMLQHGYGAQHVIAALQQQADFGRIDWAAIVADLAAGNLRRVK